MKQSLFCLLFFAFTSAFSQEKTTNTFSVTDGNDCTEMVTYENHVTISAKGNYRVITSNAIPAHATGKFPNSGNPNRISPQNKNYKIPLKPKMNTTFTSVYSNGFLGQGRPAYIFGVAINGVNMEPTAMEFFVNPETRQINLEWSKEALSKNVNLGDDCNNAHVQPTGEYHYHGTPWGIVKNAQPNHMFLVGWAADGFPIYYKYGYASADATQLVAMKSSYRLKSGNRPGDGISAPNGMYDGTYVRDFEYVAGLGDLDEANGRFGKTPEFPKGTYYYVITDDFPSLPRFFAGTPDESFKVIDQMRGRRGGNERSSRRNGRRFDRRNARRNSEEPPSEAQIFQHMDTNRDGKLSKAEVKGPLQRDFSKLDTDNDGFISKKELKNAPTPR